VATACRSGQTRQTAEAQRRREATEDTAFAAVQTRGARAMGVDQYTSSHRFTSLPDGGRIELERDVSDAEGAAQIRRHMRLIAAAFANGDFSLPGFVHDHEVPGTRVMTAQRADISYTVESLPRGGALRLQSSDSGAIAAIHEFLAFQRQDHHAGAGGEGKDPHHR
jgi:hypothetical protein